MQDDVSFLEWAFKGMVGIILTVGGWLWVRLMAAVTQNSKDISDHKLHVSESYAKKVDLNPIYDTLKNIQYDIKTLLGRRHTGDDDDRR